MFIILSGCATKVNQLPSVQNDNAAGTRENDPASRDDAYKEGPSPKAMASLQITNQGKQLIQQNKPDDAIRALERAINLDPGNGQNYYYLAEAWILKKNVSQAFEFNRLASIYLRKDRNWEQLLLEQKERIVRLSRTDNN